MIVSRVQQNEVMAKIGVTDDEARKYYESQLGEFTTPPTVTLREILVATPTDPKGLNVGADDAAKAKAEEKSGEHAGGSATGVAGPAGSAAGPVIAVFSAAKVEVKANSRVEFILAEPFTFARPPVTNAPQGR